MLLPPPNVTGNLHLGHALMATVQDVIARQRQHLGYEVDWVPGTDHAGIATQVVVERTLAASQGKTRQELGRPAFLDEVWRWKAEKGTGIVQDLRQLGCRLNWQREYFTMDEQQAHAVNVAFERLFDEGLIRRRNSLVNWSTALRSAISDIEVDVIDIKEPVEIAVPGYERNVLFGRIYDFAYRVVDGETLPDGSVEEIVVSTTRPETILGDVAVAVHPLDPRYSKYRHLEEVKLKHPFLTLGTVNKMYMEFEEQPFPKDWVGFFCFWLAEDLKELRKTEYFWLEGITGCHKITCQPRLLMAWVGGSFGRHMETLSDKKVLEGLQWLFRKFLTFEIPPPKRFHRSKWFSNPNFRGTWTFRPTKADERETGPRDLEAPVMGEDGHLGLLFAGEASSRNHFSTVHGAVEAGWREADRLIRLYSTCGSKS